MSVEKPDSSRTPQGPQAGTQSLLEQYEHVRSELGKAVAERDALRRSLSHLQEKLERTTLQLRQLEQVFTDHERSPHAVIYYRLRAIWSICHQQLATLAEQMTTKLMGPDRERHEKRMRDERARQSQTLEARLNQLTTDRAIVLGKIRGLEEELVKHNKIYQRGVRRQLEESILQLKTKLAAYDAQRRSLEQERERLVHMPLPPYPGLPVSHCREVNLFLIALAQQNYLLFAEDRVAELALEAQRVGATQAHYGSAEDCANLDRSIRERLLTFRSRSLDGSMIRRRTERLRKKVRYASDDDTVPLAETVNSIDEDAQLLAGDGPVRGFDQPVPVNVLVLDYWNLGSVLLKPPSSE